MSGFNAQRVGDVRERTRLMNDRVPREYGSCLDAARERQQWRHSGIAWAILRGWHTGVQLTGGERRKIRLESAGEPLSANQAGSVPGPAVLEVRKCDRFQHSSALPSWSWISFERRQRSRWFAAIVGFVRIRNCTIEFITGEELCVTSVHSF